ncbi:MAG: histone deacetylase [Pseudomonadota bacterium]
MGQRHPILVHHADYDAASVPDAHRFPMRKYSIVAQLLKARGFGFANPHPATPEELERVHRPGYVSDILNGTLDQKVARRIGFEITPAVARRARAAVGGTTLAARYALLHGAAANLAGGSHHAGPDAGAGFCVFNDVAVAAEVVIAEGEVKRVLIVDLDVHHGDGTAVIFAGREDVFTFSVHCEENWPRQKPPSDLDIGLPRGTGDGMYLMTLRKGLAKALDLARPDLIFYNAGVDPHQDDRLGYLCLTDGGLAERDRIVISACRKSGVPVCGVLGGGYSKDAEAVARRHLFLVDALTDQTADSAQTLKLTT